MQRREPEGVVITCDFCGTDWDEVIPMIEGHHGSVLCLSCLKKALESLVPAPAEFPCTLCLQTHPVGDLQWVPSPLPATANQRAMACKPCIFQAAGTFSKDKDVDWKWVR